MAIAKMNKLRLIGLIDDRDGILNLLQKTGCVHLSESEDLADTFVMPDEQTGFALAETYNRIKEAILFFEDRVDAGKKNPKYERAMLALASYAVTLDEFINAKALESEVYQTVEKFLVLKKELATGKSLLLKANNLIANLKTYEKMGNPFSFYKNTEFTCVFLGTIKQEFKEKVKELAEQDLCDVEFLTDGQTPVINFVTVKEKAEEIERALGELSFNKCPFDYPVTAKTKIEQLNAEILSIERREQAITDEVLDCADKMRALKIVADYYKFQIEKQVASDNFRRTEKTFVLDAYFPLETKERLINALEQSGFALAPFVFEPTETDQPPTLTKNKNPVKQTEFVTDMYSVPSYREVDPNKAVFFFFMLFMGVIMADIGYGLLMTMIGVLLASRIKVDNGAKRLWNVVALSGIATVVFGVLFNSIFGFSLPYQAPLPSPVPKGGNVDGLMTILLLCLLLGVIHIATGYFVKALNSFKERDIAGGIFDGLTWVVFFIGLFFATFNFLINYLMPNAFKVMDNGVKEFFNLMALPGVIMAVGSVVIAMLTAGRNEKGFGKFSKGFGAVYGIINILSDILSYARLFGLMLSGMIIASTFNDMGLGMASAGGFAVIPGGLIMVVGHAFNIAMGVLGAYIHNSRLQYIEFFGKFYTGEGVKFTPLGSEFDYLYLVNK